MRTKLGSWMGACLLVAACTSLPDIPRNSCGNHVLEAGEDCDTSQIGDDKSLCRAPGQVGACRFDCTTGPDGTRTPCPSGWSCGSDSICRAAKGEFSALAGQIPSDANALGLSDYDGDGLQDVREVSNSDIRIRFGDPAGDLGQTMLISAPGAHPAAGVLTTDPLLDLAFSAGGAVAVWRGATNRTMSPTTYPSIPIPTTDPVSFVTAEVLRKRAGVEVVTLLSDNKGGSVLSVRDSSELDGTANVVLFALKRTAGELVFPMKAAQLDEDPVQSPCDEIVLAFKGATEIDVFPTCRGDVANTVGPAQRSLAPVVLPPERTLVDALVVDLDRDGHLDILIVADEEGIFFALGNGDGTFRGPIESTEFEALRSSPLDVGFLTADDMIDVVTPGGILLVTPPPNGPPVDAGDAAPPTGDAGAPDLAFIATSTGVNWTEAHIVDLNGDGRLDVVAGSPHRLDVLINSGDRLFDPHPYRLDGTPSLITFGDFDGDLVVDLAFKEHFDEKTPDSLTVGFGTTGGVPLQPESQGSIGNISVVSTGALSADSADVAADGLADIGALAKTLDGKIQFVSVLSGSPDRLLQSPFVLTRTKNKAVVPSAALSFAVGQFTADAHADLAVLAVEAEADKSIETHAWLVPVTGDAAIDLATVTAGPVVDAFNVDPATHVQSHGLSWLEPRAEMVAVDLDAAPGGQDEVVALVQPVQESRDAGALILLKAKDGAFSVASKVAVGRDAVGGASWSLKKADIDADGAPDVLVTFHDDAGMHAQVFFNKHDGALDPAPVSVPIPPGTQLLAWAALNADADKAREIAMLTDKGVFIADLDASKTSFTVAPKPVSGVTGQGNVIACGDIDGDGIDDIAIAGAGVLQIFRGLPVLQ